MEKKQDKLNILNYKSPIAEPTGGDWRDDEDRLKPEKKWIRDEDVPSEENEDTLINKVDQSLQNKNEEIPEPALGELSDSQYSDMNQKYEPDLIELNPESRGHMASAHANGDEVMIVRENINKLYEKEKTGNDFGINKIKDNHRKRELSSIEKHYFSSSKRKGTSGSKKGVHAVTSIAYKDNLKTIPDTKKQRGLRERIRSFLNKPL